MVSSTLCPAVHILGSQNVYSRAEGIADDYWPWPGPSYFLLLYFFYHYNPFSTTSTMLLPPTMLLPTTILLLTTRPLLLPHLVSLCSLCLLCSLCSLSSLISTAPAHTSLTGLPNHHRNFTTFFFPVGDTRLLRYNSYIWS